MLFAFKTALPLILVAGFTFGPHGMTTPGCPGEDDDSPTPSIPPTSDVHLTISIDTTSLADGINQLSEVFSGQAAYLVGDFTAWNPNHPDFMMQDPENDGIWTYTLTFPLQAVDYYGEPYVVYPGDMIEYKFAKTTSDPDNLWIEGEKNYQTQQEEVCWSDPDAAGALWEVPNRQLEVPHEDTTLALEIIDAWKATAESYGYISCD